MRAHAGDEVNLAPALFPQEEGGILFKLEMDLIALEMRAKPFVALQAGFAEVEEPKKTELAAYLPPLHESPTVFNVRIAELLRKLKASNLDSASRQKAIQDISELLIQSKNHLNMWEVKLQQIEKEKRVPKELKDPAKGRIMSGRYLRQLIKISLSLPIEERKAFLEIQLRMFEERVLNSAFWQERLANLERERKAAAVKIKSDQADVIKKKNAGENNTWHKNIVNNEKFLSVINAAIDQISSKKSPKATPSAQARNKEIDTLIVLLQEIKNLRNEILSKDEKEESEDEVIKKYLLFAHQASDAEKLLSSLGLRREFQSLYDVLTTAAAFFRSVNLKDHHQKEKELEELYEYSKTISDAKATLAQPEHGILQEEVKRAENCSSAISIMGNIFKYAPDLSFNATQESIEAGLANASATIKQLIVESRDKVQEATEEIEAADRKIADAKARYGFTVRIRVGLGLGSEISEALAEANTAKAVASQAQKAANFQLMKYLQLEEELNTYIEEYNLVYEIPEPLEEFKEEKKTEPPKVEAKELKRDLSGEPALTITDPEAEFEQFKKFAEVHEWAKPMVAMIAVFGAGFGFDVVKDLNLRGFRSELEEQTHSAVMRELEKDIAKSAHGPAAPSQQAPAPSSGPRLT